LRCGFPGAVHRFEIANAVGKVGVAVDQTGKNSHLAEIDDRGT
jgi:hypothetical protein